MQEKHVGAGENPLLPSFTSSKKYTYNLIKSKWSMVVELLIFSRDILAKDERKSYYFSNLKKYCSLSLTSKELRKRRWWSQGAKSLSVNPRLQQVETTSVMARSIQTIRASSSSRAPGNQQCTQKWYHLCRQRWIYSDANRASLSGTLLYPGPWECGGVQNVLAGRETQTTLQDHFCEAFLASYLKCLKKKKGLNLQGFWNILWCVSLF